LRGLSSWLFGFFIGIGKMAKGKKYSREYYLAHRERINIASRKWKLAHPCEVKASYKEWALAHPEQKKKNKRKHYLAHGKEENAIRREWRLAHPKEAKAEDRKHYLANKEKRKIKARGKYRTDPEKSRTVVRKWRRTHKDETNTINKKWKARRRKFGFIPLNKPFPGADGHHVDRERVIYMPKKLHRSIWHSVLNNINMDKINKIAFNWLKSEKLHSSRAK
jgi:hypothetical protein